MQNNTAIIKCAQCGADLIVPDRSEYVDEYRLRHIWKCEPCGYTFEATIATRQRCTDACESYGWSALPPKADIGSNVVRNAGWKHG